MTKLAHIHFTTNQQASNRLLAMGEAPWRVHTVGFPAIDLIQDNNYATSNELVDLYNLNLKNQLFYLHNIQLLQNFMKQQIKLSLHYLLLKS